MTQPVLHTQVWLLSGMTGSEEGILQLADGRIIFTSIDGQTVFDARLPEVSEMEFPWYYFGGGMKLRIAAERYRVSFLRPGNTGGGIGDIAPGRRVGKLWKAALARALASHA